MVDVETTGTVPSKHSIVSIGALDLDNPNNRFYGECRIWDGAHVEDKALEINGFSKEQLTDTSKQSEAELVTQFLTWSKSVSDRTLSGQNPSFDRDFLEAAAMRAGLNWNMAHRTVDTHSLCYMHMLKNGQKPPFDEVHHHSALNLDAILNYCGIPEEPKPHNAMNGALSHAEVTYRLLYSKTLLSEFSEYPLPWVINE